MESPDLVVRVRGTRGRESEGRVTDLRQSRDGSTLHVEFADESAPDFPIGENVGLVLSDPITTRQLPFAGKLIAHLRDGVHQHRCEFELGTEVAQEVGPTVNRRRAVRIKPDPNNPVIVTLRPRDGGKPATPLLHDISTGGVGLLVSPDDETAFFAHWEVELSLRLPDSPEALELVGAVRVRRLLGSAILYGVEFDSAKTARFADKETQLRRYVMQRQIAMIRALKDAGAT